MTEEHASLGKLAATAGLSALAAAGLTAAWFRSRAAAVDAGNAAPGTADCSCRVQIGPAKGGQQRQQPKRDPYDPLPRIE